MKVIAIVSMLSVALISAVGISICVSVIADFFRRRSVWNYDLGFAILLFVCILGIVCVFVHTFYSGIIILME